MELNRREFFGGMALAAAGGKLRMGLIGCGWYGMVDLRAALASGGVECIALCDIDSQHLSEAASEVEKLQGSRPKTFKLYRELLEMPELQALIIATPPHWHALPFLDACRRGLDIYCEKPLAYDIREGRAMVEGAKKSKGIVQIGFQRRQAAAIGQAREYIRQGNAGRIVQVDVQIHFSAATPDPTPQAPPASLDWEMWCGPGPKMPYSPAIGHKSWRLEATSGNGHLVDWGIHLMDATRYILGE
jgi:predicted dehydrogenase